MDIEALLKQTIQIKVVEAFNETPEMVEKLVQAALSKEVDQDGRSPSGYGSKSMPYMEWLVGEEIRRAVQVCLKEYIAEHNEELKEKVDAAIKSSDFSTTLSNTLSRILSDEWRWNVDLKVSEK
jgi:hypothetical protein